MGNGSVMRNAARSRKTGVRTNNLRPLTALVAANVMLAFGPVFVRLTDAGPVSAGFWRLALAVPVLLVVSAAIGQRSVAQARGLWRVPVIGGLAFAANLAAWHLGIHRTALANASLLGNAAVLIYPIYGFLIVRAWPTRMQGIALALALAGAMLLMGRSAQISTTNLIGDLLCLLAGVIYIVYFVTMARARERMHPLPVLAWSSAAGALPLLVLAIVLGEPVWPQDWAPPVALAIVSQVVGQGLTIYALAHLSPLVVGIALLLQPMVAVAIGWAMFGERLDAAGLTGAVLVAAALVLVARGNGSPLASGAPPPHKDG